MHVVVAIVELGLRLESPLKLVSLSLEENPERRLEPWVEEDRSQPMETEKTPNPRQVLADRIRHPGPVQRLGEVQVQAEFDGAVSSQNRGSLRILHEDHGAC